MDGAQADGGCCAAPFRFSDEVLRRKLRSLFGQDWNVVAACNNKNTLWGKQQGNPVDGMLKHGTLADQLERLLGAVLAAERPQTRPGAPGHN